MAERTKARDRKRRDRNAAKADIILSFIESELEIDVESVITGRNRTDFTREIGALLELLNRDG